MDKKSFGKRLNIARKEQQVTSEGLSEKCGVNAVFIRQIENSSRLPSLPVFIKLCNALQTSPNYLLNDSLELNEQEQFDNLLVKMRSLTPKQINVVMATIETLIEKLEE